jgi:hypothetical protein
MVTAQGCMRMLVPGRAAQGPRHMGMPHAGACKSALPHAITFGSLFTYARGGG